MAVALAVVWLPACASSKPFSVTSSPVAASIKVDQQTVGTTPVSFTNDFKARPSFVVTATATGYVEEQITVTKDSTFAREGALRITLQEDEAFKLTTTSEATNNWIRIQIDRSIAADAVWQKLVDSVTGRYSSIEQMDSGSGYMRSIPIVRRFKSRKSDVRIRTRFVATVSSKSPLVYKIKIESEYSDSLDWYPFDRVFKEDAALIEELQARLGQK